MIVLVRIWFYDGEEVETLIPLIEAIVLERGNELTVREFDIWTWEPDDDHP